MAANPSASKFQTVTETLLPNRCVWCWVAANGKNIFVDGGMSLDDEDPWYKNIEPSALGVLYTCENCAIEIGVAVGCLPPNLSEILQGEVAHLQEHVEARDSEIERLNGILSAYGISSIVTDPDPVVDEANDEIEGLGNPEVVDAESGSAEPSSK